MRTVTGDAGPWIERLARLGYISKGVVFAIIGLFAAAAGLGMGGHIADKKDAFTEILRKPFGREMLLIIAAGLAGYALWRVLAGVADTERRGAKTSAILIRIGSVARGLMYAWIAFGVLRFALRKHSLTSSDANARAWTARAMDHPLGRVAVALTGLTIVGYGIYQLGRALLGKLPRNIRFENAAASVRSWLRGVSRFGIGARGAVFGVIGGSFVAAALHHRSGDARGLGGALRKVATAPFGGFLLTVAGLGLLAYGIYAFINARYRTIRA